MRWFLRLASQDAFCGEVDEGRRGKARDAFSLRQNPQEQGLSLYLATSEEEINLVVAAIACSRLARDPRVTKMRQVDLLPIEVDRVEQFGEALPTPGTTPLPRVNMLHHELNWSQERLWELAENVFGARLQVRRFRPEPIKDILAQLRLDEVDPKYAEVLDCLRQFR